MMRFADVILPVLGTLMLSSFVWALAMMVYDSLLPYPGIGPKLAKAVTVAYLGPAAIVLLLGIGFALGEIWN